MSDEEYIYENGTKIHKNEKIFYNPAQKFNRDLTISVINTFLEGKTNIKIFEAMSATGLRGIRFIKEIEANCEIHLNDSDSNAISGIKENLSLNEIKPLGKDPNIYEYKNKKVHISQMDCNALLYMNRKKFDVIDIDPFGCCTSFIDSAISNIRDNGLLCLTSTDTGVLCSNKKKCFLKYNSIVTKIPACHEQALRILLGYIVQQAGKYEKSIEPILSVSVDFYIRVFVIVKNKNFLKNIQDISYYSICDCYNHLEHKILDQNRNIKINDSICGNCKNKFSLIGPLYNKLLSKKNFIESLLKKEIDNRIRGILEIIFKEIDSFLFYSIPDLCSNMKTSCIPVNRLVSAILKKGYLVSLTHCKLNSIKTNAPIKILYDLIKLYFEDPEKSDNIFDTTDEAKLILKGNYFRGLAASNMGPLSKPKK